MHVIDSSTKGFLEILSNVLVAQERSLSFTYGKPDESRSSFTLMYFGKRSDKFVLEPLNFADDCVRCCYGRKLAGHIVYRSRYTYRLGWVRIFC